MAAVAGKLRGELAVLAQVRLGGVEQHHLFLRGKADDGAVELAQLLVVDVVGQLIGAAQRVVHRGHDLEVHHRVRLELDHLVKQLAQALLIALGRVAQLVYAQHDVHALVLLQRQDLQKIILLPVHLEYPVVLAVRLEHRHSPGPVEVAVLQAAEELKSLGPGVAQIHRRVEKGVVLHRFALLQRCAEVIGLHRLRRGERFRRRLRRGLR